MLRITLTAFAVVLGIGAVVAQSDPIAERKDLMRKNNGHARTMLQMMRGTAPFDAAKIDEAFAQWEETGKKLPGLFPADSKTGGETHASPKIWENKADFDAKSADFAKSSADNRAAAKLSLDGLKKAVSIVGNTCDSCHEIYRLSR